MFRKFRISLLSVILLATAVSLSHAYPQRDEQFRMMPFWQRDNYDILGCLDDDLSCRYHRSDKTIAKYGCALTSMAMLYWHYGFWYIPDKFHDPRSIYNGNYITNRFNPSRFNKYLSAKDLFGWPIGFVSLTYDFDWIKTTSNFYYHNDTSGAYGTGLHYKYLVPNYNCSPINIQVQKKNGTFKTVKKSASCYRVDWSTPGAMTWLDYDIAWPNDTPAIVKIKYTNISDPKKPVPHPSHFVVIAGYDRTPDKGSDVGWYRAHNPTFYDNQADNIPKALNGPTQYGKKGKDKYGNSINLFSFDGMVTLYRFTGKHSRDPLETSQLDLQIHSPVEVQVIDPDGNLIGYDPETGENFLENPMSLYYEETPVTALDGSDDPSEPYKRLTIIQPRQGNYILKVFGIGDGPYTINMQWTKSDGTPNLVHASSL